MKTLKILWKRFQSDTPGILKKTRNICLGVTAFCASATGTLIANGKFPEIVTVFILIGGFTTALAGGIAVGLQLSTSDTKVQKLSDSETGLPK